MLYLHLNELHCGENLMEKICWPTASRLYVGQILVTHKFLRIIFGFLNAGYTSHFLMYNKTNILPTAIPKTHYWQSKIFSLNNYWVTLFIIVHFIFFFCIRIYIMIFKILTQALVYKSREQKFSGFKLNIQKAVTLFRQCAAFIYCNVFQLVSQSVRIRKKFSSCLNTMQTEC